MKSKLWPKVVAGLVLILLGWCGSNVYHAFKNQSILEHNELLTAQVNVLEATRAQERAQFEEEIATLRGMVTSASTIIAGLEEERDSLQGTIEARDQTIIALKTAEVEELIARYPALARFTLALEQQISDLKALDLKNRAIIEEKDTQILNLEGIIALKDKTIASVTKDYEDEKRLRIQTQKDFADYRQKPGPASIWTKLFWSGVGLAYRN